MKAIRSLEQHVDSLMSYDFTGAAAYSSRRTILARRLRRQRRCISRVGCLVRAVLVTIPDPPFAYRCIVQGGCYRVVSVL